MDMCFEIYLAPKSTIDCDTSTKTYCATVWDVRISSHVAKGIGYSKELFVFIIVR